jgi:hypothetical protein
MKLKAQLSLIIASFTILIAVPGGAKADAVSDWNLIAIQRIGAAGSTHGAPVAFIEMAIVQAAVYDAVQAIERDYEPYGVEIPGASGSPEAAAAKAAHDILVNLFPTQTSTIDGIYNQYLIDHNLSPIDPGVAVGATAAAGIIALRANDGRFPPGQIPFVGGTEPGQWRPTDSFQGSPPAPPPFSPMAAPWVANVTPFALRRGDQFRAAPPPRLNSHKYTRDYNEVKAFGARFNSARSVEQTNLALFWATNYAALWNQVVRDIAASRSLNISDNARLTALVNLSMADAAITAWDSKVAYNFWRPLTAIRLGHDDNNRDTVGDPTWEPLINTPNYPDHTSGANNTTAAATRSLAFFFCTDRMTFIARTTNAASPITQITYNRFSDAAEDVVNARIYEGIHWRFADEAARRQGRHVARWTFRHVLRPRRFCRRCALEEEEDEP